MPSARFDGVIPMYGTWQACVDYILEQYAHQRIDSETYFWRLTDDNGNSVVGDNTRVEFSALVEGGEAARLLVEFAGRA